MLSEQAILTLSEVAERYRISERQLRSLIGRHKVPVLRLGRQIRFDDLALEALAEAFRVGSSPPSKSLDKNQWDSSLLDPSAFEAALAATASPPLSTDGYVYFIESGDLIKIGTSKDPGGRLTTLQGASGHHMKIICLIEGGPAMERQLHQEFSAHRVRGEWFSKCEAIDQFIENARRNKRSVSRKRRRRLNND